MKVKIVNTTSVFEPGYPAERAIERLAALGFEALDMALDYCTNVPEFLGDRHVEWAEGLKQKALAAGVSFTHAHAPGDVRNNSLLANALETAGALGARYLVLHPVCRDEDGHDIDNEEAFIRLNAEAIRPWLKKAEECGVVLLSENLLWGAARDPRIIAKLVCEVNSPWFGWCFDTGHANCFGFPPDTVEQCAVPPLSLHLQDNRGTTWDDHLIPGEGVIDWDRLIASLMRSGYAGDCVLEAHEQSLETPDDKREEVLARLMAAARVLRAKMEG